MVRIFSIVSILPHAEFGPNSHREDAPLTCISDDKTKTSQEFLKLQCMLDTCPLDDAPQRCEIEPREAPSAMTALDILKSNHQNEYSKLKSKVGDMKAREVNDQMKIQKLKNAIHYLTTD